MRFYPASVLLALGVLGLSGCKAANVVTKQKLGTGASPSSGDVASVPQVYKSADLQKLYADAYLSVVQDNAVDPGQPAMLAPPQPGTNQQVLKYSADQAARELAEYQSIVAGQASNERTTLAGRVVESPARDHNSEGQHLECSQGAVEYIVEGYNVATRSSEDFWTYYVKHAQSGGFSPKNSAGPWTTRVNEIFLWSFDIQKELALGQIQGRIEKARLDISIKGLPEIVRNDTFHVFSDTRVQAAARSQSFKERLEASVPIGIGSGYSAKSTLFGFPWNSGMVKHAQVDLEKVPNWDGVPRSFLDDLNQNLRVHVAVDDDTAARAKLRVCVRHAYDPLPPKCDCDKAARSIRPDGKQCFVGLNELLKGLSSAQLNEVYRGNLVKENGAMKTVGLVNQLLNTDHSLLNNGGKAYLAEPALAMPYLDEYIQFAPVRDRVFGNYCQMPGITRPGVVIPLFELWKHKDKIGEDCYQAIDPCLIK